MTKDKTKGRRSLSMRAELFGRFEWECLKRGVKKTPTLDKLINDYLDAQEQTS